MKFGQKQRLWCRSSCGQGIQTPIGTRAEEEGCGHHQRWEGVHRAYGE